MAIQMRRGQLADFNPAKMLPGEWAVSTDVDSGDQHVYMCFMAGVVKRMATHEDFEADMEAISDLIVNGNAAAAAAQAAADKANNVVANKIGIDDTKASSTTTYSSNYINDSLSSLQSSLKPVLLWSGSTTVAGTILDLSSSISNYKTLIIQYGTPAANNVQLGYGSTIVRRWLESATTWLDGAGTVRQIAFSTPSGYIQLGLVSVTELTVLHADNSVRAVYGVSI